MDEKTMEEIEKIVQHTAKTVTHNTAPETRELITALDNKVTLHMKDKEDRLGELAEGLENIHQILEKQNESTSAFHDKVDAHIVRVEPVIKAFEAAQAEREAATKWGNRIIFIGKIILAIGSVYTAAKVGLWLLISYKP